MDKQQATEDIISKALRHSLAVCNDCSPKPDGVIAYIRSAMKAYEAQCPGDAVNFVHWVLKNGWQVLEGVTFYKEIKAGVRRIKGARDLYAEFNPSGVAPATSSRSQENAPPSAQPAGSVWVTVTQENIKDWNTDRVWDYRIIRTKDRKFIINQHDVIEIEDECFRMVDGSAIFFKDCEWLDESTPQVFTREQVADIIFAAANHFDSIPSKTELMEYVDTNYPPSK